MRTTTIAASVAALMCTTGLSLADAPAAFPLYKVDASGVETEIAFAPLASTSQKWKLCVLLPHVKDSYWVGVDYGIVEEARRLGASATIFQAGGYDQLPKQVAQFDDCLAMNPDAIIFAAISETGLAGKVKESMDRGIPTISVINPIREIDVTSKVFVDFVGKGRATGEYVKELFGDEGGEVAPFPGPQGSGWAENFYEGFKLALDGSKVVAVDAKFGDSGLPVQLRLVEDTLQSHPDIKAIWGTATAAEGAVGALQEAGLDGVKIVAHGENTQIIKLVQEGKVDAVGVEGPITQAKVAVNTALKALEKQPFEAYYAPIPAMMTKENAANFDTSVVLPPEGFQPVFSVE
jgi:protein TorT